MNRVVKVVSLATAMACASMGAVNSAYAQNNGDPLSLKIANAISPDRFFIRAGVIGVKVKTESEDTYDVTGPVISKAELEGMLTNNNIRDYILSKGESLAVANNIQGVLRGDQGINFLLQQMGEDRDNLDVLGTPKGIKAISQEEMGTAGLSLGYYLDDEYKWVVEAYVLAAPVSASVKATRPGTWYDDESLTPIYRPFGLEGQKILTTKLLPPTVMLGRYWGGKESKFRPYTGLLAMYAIFYDTKASDALNSYQGGSNPGDTTASLKNTFGIGPMLGFKYQMSDSWHASLNIGSVKLKTEGTIVTRNSSFDINTPAILDYGRATENGTFGSIYNTAVAGEGSYSNPTGSGSQRAVARNGGVTSILTSAAAYARTGDAKPTYVRKAKSTLTNTIFMLSVGRSF